MYTIHSRGTETHFLIIHQYKKMAKNLQLLFDKKWGMLILNSFIYSSVMICWGTIKRLSFVTVREGRISYSSHWWNWCHFIRDIQVLNPLFTSQFSNEHYFFLNQRRNQTLLHSSTWNVAEFTVRSSKMKKKKINKKHFCTFRVLIKQSPAFLNPLATSSFYSVYTEKLSYNWIQRFFKVYLSAHRFIHTYLHT